MYSRDDYIEEFRVIFTNAREIVFKSSESYNLVVHINDDNVTVEYQTVGENKVKNQYTIPNRNVLYFNRQYALKET